MNAAIPPKDAIRYAVDIEAFCRAELQRRGDVGYARKRNFSFKCHQCGRKDRKMKDFLEKQTG